jgi:hypothetical protein
MGDNDGKEDDKTAKRLWSEFLSGTTLHGAQHTTGTHAIRRLVDLNSDLK